MIPAQELASELRSVAAAARAKADEMAALAAARKELDDANVAVAVERALAEAQTKADAALRVAAINRRVPTVDREAVTTSRSERLPQTGDSSANGALPLAVGGGMLIVAGATRRRRRTE